ncbi:helix-turn-helix transcriptional regulator [Roseateles sp. L2-2]|uniref:helix-turn-helix transcriptional regulator n=1 Tax=Roseateles sp. L2-2 TaxID=3422597 RepID=UPI003D36FEB3
MKDFIRELEVSQASVKRDLDFLRDRMGCPLAWNAKKRGYVINDTEGNRFQLPGVWFEASEVFALLTMLHLVEGVQPGLLAEHVGPLKTRLKSMLSEGTTSRRSIESKVRLIHFAPRKVQASHFREVASALLDGKKLHLRYWNRDRNDSTERTISPQKLVHYRENWLLDAWCHQREALRSFALESIQSVQALEEEAVSVSPEVMEEHFRAGYGIFAGPVLHKAKLKFTRQRAQWISQETWHHSQTTSTESDGSFILEVPYSNDQELLMDIMRHSPEVEVLAPAELRCKLHEALCAAAAKNLPAAGQ